MDCTDAVDSNHSGVKPRAYTERAIDILGEYARHQSILAVVRPGQHFFFCFEFVDYHDRAKYLFFVDGRIRLGVGENGWFNVVALHPVSIYFPTASE